MTICADEGCDRTDRIKRGLCHRHYELRRREGQLELRDPDPVRRFWSRVDRSGDCWVWTGALSTAGYGRVSWHGRPEQAHRTAYELTLGPIPDGLDLDHLCRNRACVKPTHMQPVTHRTNLLRGQGIPAKKAIRTTCNHGHPFTPENTYEWRGARHCHTCRAQATAKRDRRRPHLTITATCVLCQATFTYVRGPGGRAPNVCSDACRKDRQRRTAREFQRRKREALR